MQLGYIGLGKMGFNMVERLLEKGHEVIVFDKNKEAIKAVSAKGARPATALKEMLSSISAPRLIWIMVPYQVVDTILEDLKPFLETGDVIIDGGNSPYKESMRRATELRKHGAHFLDVGVSGGPRGAREGACLMVGGDKPDYEKLEPLLKDLAVIDGYGYMGKHGAGHFVKMVHNGIEYGMMQALAEGFAIMKESDFHLNLKEISRVYNHGSVIEARLTGWLDDAFTTFGEDLEEVSGSVQQSGEGLWTIQAAKELGISVKIIEGALKFRLNSQKHPSYTSKILSALRNQFGGHSIKDLDA
jgi:6-phosphogluconate dehydrogenase